MPNRALVLSGGGSKGAFELGAVDYLVNGRGLDFQVIAGVSTGSLNAVVLAQGAGLAGIKTQVTALKHLWFGIRSNRDIYTPRFLGKILAFISKNSIYSSEPLRRKLEQVVSPQRLATSGKDLRVGAVVLESGDYVSIAQRNSSIRAWALASASMPILFPPVAADGNTAVDGGVRNITPLKDAFEALKARAKTTAERESTPGAGDDPEPDEMYIILANPLGIQRETGPWKTGIDIAKRSVGILSNEIFRSDLERAFTVNQAVEFYGRVEEKLQLALGRDQARKFLESIPFPYRPPDFRYVRLWTVLPEKEYSETLEFDPKAIREAYDGGREAARRALGETEFAALLNASAVRAA
jgi:NTE family protein